MSKNRASANCKISVIIPAFNAEAYLPRAIASVQEQTFGDWELWVIDDASADGTGRIARDYAAADSRIHYDRQQKNQGVAAARNRGLELANGDYVAFLDADDWWLPEKLEKQMELLARTGAVLCCTARELMHPNGTPTGKVVPVPGKITYRGLLKTNVIPCGSVVLRRDAARRYGFVHDECHEDYILWLRILDKYGDAVGLNEPMLKCRLSAGGKSRNKLKSARMQYGSYRILGYGRLKSFYYMLFYTINGILKYL